jgi:hypothetical protein
MFYFKLLNFFFFFFNIINYYIIIKNKKIKLLSLIKLLIALKAIYKTIFLLIL